MADSIGRIKFRTRNGLKIAAIQGEVDVSNVEDIQKELEAAEEEEPIRVIDLSETTYFDSAGIRMLFSIGSRLMIARHRLQVIVPKEGAVRRVLELTDLAKVADIHAGVDEIQA